MLIRRFAKVLICLLFLYVGSYVFWRTAHTFNNERDGCPVRGCNYVVYPGGVLYLTYRPIIAVDKLTMDDTEYFIE